MIRERRRLTMIKNRATNQPQINADRSLKAGSRILHRLTCVYPLSSAVRRFFAGRIQLQLGN
jgi:hypothetical protein